MAEEGQKWTEECQKMRQRLIKLSKEEIRGDIFLVGFGDNQNKMQKNEPNTGPKLRTVGQGVKYITTITYSEMPFITVNRKSKTTFQ